MNEKSAVMGSASGIFRSRICVQIHMLADAAVLAICQYDQINVPMAIYIEY